MPAAVDLSPADRLYGIIPGYACQKKKKKKRNKKKGGKSERRNSIISNSHRPKNKGKTKNIINQNVTSDGLN